MALWTPQRVLEPRALASLTALPSRTAFEAFRSKKLTGAFCGRGRAGCRRAGALGYALAVSV